MDRRNWSYLLARRSAAIRLVNARGRPVRNQTLHPPFRAGED